MMNEGILILFNPAIEANFVGWMETQMLQVSQCWDLHYLAISGTIARDLVTLKQFEIS